MTSLPAPLAAPLRPRAAPAPRRVVLLGVAAAGVALGLTTAGLLLSGGVAPAAGLTVAVALPVGWSYLAVGIYAWRRRPDNPFGRLLTAVAFAWFAAGLAGAGNPALHTAGLALSGLYYAVLVHLLLAFPHGRVRGRTARGAVAVAYAAATAGQLLVLAVSEPAGPRNLLLVRRDPDLADVLAAATALLGAAVTVLVAAVLADRWRAAAARDRRALAPVLAVGSVLALLVAASLVVGAGAPGNSLAGPSTAAVAIALGVVPYAFLVGLARARFFTAAAVTDLLTRLSRSGGGGPLGVRSALAGALGDPGLALAYWLPERGGYVDTAGMPVRVPPRGQAATVVERAGEPIAAVLHEPSLLEDPDLLHAAGAAAALGLDNERLTAALRARVAEVEDSRHRVLAAADAERRRLERDLHDGAQQRLVTLRVALGLASAAATRDPVAARSLLDAARVELDAALSELRDLARGLHPAVLATRGLPAALCSLAARAPMPVDLTVSLTGDTPPGPDDASDDDLEQRLPPEVESTVYFVVAEALTNVAKHAAATRARVEVTRHLECLRIEVGDDGAGGADPAGAGLQGLAARVAALDGALTVTSGTRAGTVLRADIPLPFVPTPLATGNGQQENP